MDTVMTSGKYRHAEAFCLMKYAADDGSEVEWIWNSRDGVTPFISHSRTGREMRHVDWHLDRCEPNHRPQVGERIFVDLTREKAEQYARELVERNWNREQYPMSARWAAKEEAIADLVADMMEQPGQPDLVEVTQELLDRLGLAEPAMPPAQVRIVAADPSTASPKVLEIVPDLLFGRPLVGRTGEPMATPRQLSDEERRLAKRRAKRRAARKRRQKGQRRG